MTVQLFQTERFDKSFAGLNPALTHLTIGEVRDFVNLTRAEPKTWHQRFDRLRRVPTGSIIELEVAGGPRLLAHVAGQRVTLLEVGPHEIEKRYPIASVPTHLATAHAADPGFTRTGAQVLRFFGDHRDKTVSEYANELSPEWTYYLTDRQRGILVPMVKEIVRASAGNTRLFAIIGGPGTGKTSLLLKLLLDLSVSGLRPGIVMSKQLAEYVESGTAISLKRSWINASTYEPVDDGGRMTRPSHDVLLLDDPANLHLIEMSYDAAIGVRRAVVAAFDPCQFDENEDFDDKRYEALRTGYEVKEYRLRDCYRQKEQLGRAALRVMERVAESTPFLATEKVETFRAEHAQVNQLANDLRFPNPRGYEATYPDGRIEDVRKELGRIRHGPLWSHSASLLVVIDSASEAASWNWDTLTKGIRHRIVRFGDHSTQALREIKGLEFQHSILAIGSELFNDLEHGFRGSGSATYRRRRLLRIPFSRAKDSLVTIVTGPADLRGASRITTR